MTEARVRVENLLLEFIIVRFGRRWEEWVWLCWSSVWNVSEWMEEGDERAGVEGTLL